MRNLIFFLRLFGWFTIRHLVKNRWRALAVLLGIALGASVFSGVRLSVRASLESFSNSMDLIAGAADVSIIRPGGRVDETLIAPLLANPMVQTASPVLSAYVDTGDAPPFLMIGFDPLLDRPLRKWEMAQSDRGDAWMDLLKTPFTILVSNKLALENGWHAGDRAVINHSGGRREFVIAGILAAQGLASADGGRVAIADIATFQEFTGALGGVDRIDLKLVADANTDALRGLLPAGTVLVAATERKQTGEAMIESYALNLSVLSLGSLIVGMFLVYSLVALNAASRRKELAILRSTGASQRLVFALLLGEGAFFGLAGWLLALPLTGVAVRYLVQGVAGTIEVLFVRVQVDRLVADTWEIVLGLVVTVVVALLAALQPAIEGMRVAPKEALAVSDRAAAGSGSAWLPWIGMGCVALVLPLSLLPPIAGVPLPGYLAILFLFAGFALLSPAGLRLAGRCTAPVLTRISQPARLAGAYVRDSGARTAIAVGALITAVALFTALVIMIHSFRQTVSAWVGQSVSGDLFVSPYLAELNRHKTPLPQDVVRELTELSQDYDLVPNRWVFFKINGIPCQLDFLDFANFFRHGSLFWIDGDPQTVQPRLIGGDGVLISETLANRAGLGLNSRIQTQVDGRPIDLPVIGVVRDYRTRGGVVFADLSAVQQPGDIPIWSGLRIFFNHPPNNPAKAMADLRRRVLEKTGEIRLEIVDGASLRAEILQIFDETFALTTVLLVIALAVAALGIATTLTVMVLERSKQLNTLIAVGASFGQIRSMIFWEAGIIGFVGQCAGLACGWILSYLLIYVINQQSFGWTFLYQVDWPALAASFPLIILAALAAALPAIRTALSQPPSLILRER